MVERERQKIERGGTYDRFADRMWEKERIS